MLDIIITGNEKWVVFKWVVFITFDATGGGNKLVNVQNLWLKQTYLQ